MAASIRALESTTVKEAEEVCFSISNKNRPFPSPISRMLFPSVTRRAKILRDRQVEKIQRQRLLMPMLVELKPWQKVIFARIAEELEKSGFEVEPFGPQTLAVKAAPVGLEGAELERALTEVIEQSGADSDEHPQNEPFSSLRTRIAASIACHSAIKINTPLDPARMEWLLLELSKTEHPTSCPHGRPIALLYSWKEILRAFHRI